MPRIVGLDASLQGTAGFDGDDYRYVKMPSAKWAKKPIERDDIIATSVLHFARHGEPGDLDYADEDIEFWYEEYAFSRGGRAHATGELGGMIRRDLYVAGIKTYLVLPNARSIFGCGKVAKKPHVCSWVSARTGIVFETDDHADAFILYCMGREFHGLEHPMGKLPKTHLRALDNITVLT
jgi:hypothetical protein